MTTEGAVGGDLGPHPGHSQNLEKMPCFAVSTPFGLRGYKGCMSTVSNIGVSGMRAAEARLQAAASNIANAQTNGRVPSGGAAQPGDVYQPVDVVQVDQKGGGVTTSY